MESRGESPSRDPVLEPKEWIVGLYNIGIMNPLEIPHFGRGKDVNSCVKKLLELIHGGILWMDRHVPIDVDLIAEITRLPTDGEKPGQYLDEKTKEKYMEDEIKRKYGNDRGSKGMTIRQINELTTKFSTKLMECKLLRKCHKEEAPTRLIEAFAQCIKGSLLSWDPYLLNLILGDCKDAQDLGSKFHYPWLIILIALVGWGEPK